VILISNRYIKNIEVKMDGHYVININRMCNADCCFCGDTRKVRSQDSHTYDELLQGLRENRKKYESLIISGGEPTIYKNFIEYVQYAKNVCKYKRIQLTTNGFRLTYKNYCDKLINIGINSFQISFGTSNEKLYDAIYKVKNARHYVTNAIKYLKTKPVILRTNTVIHKLNLKDIPNTVEYLIKLNLDEIKLSFMDPVGASVINGKSVLIPTYLETVPYVMESFKISEKNNYKNLVIENFPICVIPEFESKISDLSYPQNNKIYYNRNKKKPEKCKKCLHFNKCNGTWINYLKQFGDEEFNPVEYN
jgi:MoaA/NifB/PqqE/SkfB family radical SAM enzyme